MRKLSIDEVKQYQIQIFQAVASFCEEHHISYWIDCGSLIGTIRHGGYIPWDDDIDIGMLRPDFERMKREFNLSNERFRFSCVDMDEDSFTPYGKVFDTTTVLYEPNENGYKSCINVDIFVYDNAPDDEHALKKMYDRRNFYQLMERFQHHGVSDYGKWYRKMILEPLYLLTNLFPKNYFVKKISDNAKKYSDKRTKRVGNFTSGTSMSCDRSVFDSFVEKKFENITVRVPSGYDRWLTSFYGNYMELPPEEKRVSHHHFIAYTIGE